MGLMRMRAGTDDGNRTESEGAGLAAVVPTPPPGERGLSTGDVTLRLQQHGRNTLVPAGARRVWLRAVLRPLADPMVVLLLIAGATYYALGDLVDAAVVVVAVVPIAPVSWILEARSERALARLRDLTARRVITWRDGVAQELAADGLVPGDLIYVAEGDVIPADGTMVGGSQLSVDESSLTGESLPIDKQDGVDGARAALLAGTTVVSGRAFARITITGPQTQYGAIRALVATIRQPPTPLAGCLAFGARQGPCASAGRSGDVGCHYGHLCR